MERTRVPMWLNLLAGIWVLISPFVLGFAGVGSALWNNVIIGIVVGLLAASRLWWGQDAWASWVNLVLGIWLIISPYALAFSGIAMAPGNNILFGIIIGVLALWAVYAVPARVVTPTFTSAEPRDTDRY